MKIQIMFNNFQVIFARIDFTKITAIWWLWI